jgi:hypothetical protein
MKTLFIRLRFWLLFATIIIVSMFFLGWGAIGHKIINQAGAKDFPDPSILGPTIVQRLTDSAAVPDTRSGKPYEPLHFMDMDRLTEFSTHSITHDRVTLFQEHGEAYIRNTVGFLPWVIDSVMTALTNQMQNKNWNKAWSTAADLGHYIGDAHQPLHTTMNYNGASKYGSGSYGVHSLYESGMIESYQSSILINPSAVHFIPSPLDTAFAIMYQSNSYVDSIYIADLSARNETGYAGDYYVPVPAIYYAALWQKTGSFTQLQFQRAAVEYGSYLYTAWINAGSPSTFVKQWNARVENFQLDQNYPNPFNPSTTISYQVPVTSHVCLKVFDLLSKQVVTLVNEAKPPGTYSIQWNADKFASGIYIYRLTIGGSSIARKMILLK